MPSRLLWVSLAAERRDVLQAGAKVGPIGSLLRAGGTLIFCDRLQVARANQSSVERMCVRKLWAISLPLHRNLRASRSNKGAALVQTRVEHLN